MRKTLPILSLIILLVSCNLITEKFSLVYTTENPNEAFAEQLKVVLEESYNVNIQLVQVSNTQTVLDSLGAGTHDMGFVENLINVGEGINTVVPIFVKVLHLFYKENFDVNSIEELFLDRSIYIGTERTASYRFMTSLFEFYRLDTSRLHVTRDIIGSDVIALFSVIMDEEQLQGYSGYKLYSLSSTTEIANRGSEIDGIVLKFPRVKPYIIPKKTYGNLTEEPIGTIATDMIYVVREGLWQTTVSDLTRSIFAHRDKFVHLNPSFYFGIIEDFDRSKLSHPLHEGARAFLDRDEPSFLERYAEVGGVLLAILVALSSGTITFTKWRKQNKKDKVDTFYERLMSIKNEMATIRSVEIALQKIQEVKGEQNKAFKMLINEELAADESFSIYMELSKATLQEIQSRLRVLKARAN